jgi:hypothetical protein
MPELPRETEDRLISEYGLTGLYRYKKLIPMAL